MGLLKPPIFKKISDIEASLGEIANVSKDLNFASDGTYLLKTNAIYDLNGLTITITKNIKIIGNGAIIKNGVINNVGEILLNCQNIIFDNCYFSMGSVGDFTINKCTFINCNDNAIMVWGSANLLKITDCKFDNIKVSTGTDKNFNNSGSAIYINTSSNINNCEIRDNKMTNIYGGTCIFVSANFNFIDICKNYIDTIGQRGIGFWNANVLSKGVVRFNTILNCGVLKTSGANAGVGCNGIYTNYSMVYVDVFKNFIKDVYENGIEGDYRTIEGNYIENTGKDQVNYPTPSIEGIFTLRTLIIKNNTIVNPAGHGIYGYKETDFNNMVIQNNIIKKDVFDSNHSGICFRSTNCQNVSNICIDGNIIENFNTVIEIPTNKNYDVKIGTNYAKGYTKYLVQGLIGKGIDCSKNGYPLNLFQDNLFKNWTNSSTLTNWSSANAIVSQTINDNHYVPHVLANDTYNGRIYQTLFMPQNPSNNSYIQLTLNMRGTGIKFIRVWKLDVDGINPSNPSSYNFTMLSSTVFNKYNVLIYCNGYAKIEICNTDNGEWFEIEDIQTLYVNYISES